MVSISERPPGERAPARAVRLVGVRAEMTPPDGG